MNIRLSVQVPAKVRKAIMQQTSRFHNRSTPQILADMREVHIWMLAEKFDQWARPNAGPAGIMRFGWVFRHETTTMSHMHTQGKSSLLKEIPSKMALTELTQCQTFNTK